MNNLIDFNTTILTTDAVITNTTLDKLRKEDNVNLVMMISTIITSIGIMANLSVVVVFLNQKKLRNKIPHIFIINQVGYVFIFNSFF